jgi:hypothetical protein
MMNEIAYCEIWARQQIQYNVNASTDNRRNYNLASHNESLEENTSWTSCNEGLDQSGVLLFLQNWLLRQISYPLLIWHFALIHSDVACGTYVTLERLLIPALIG